MLHPPYGTNGNLFRYGTIDNTSGYISDFK